MAEQRQVNAVRAACLVAALAALACAAGCGEAPRREVPGEAAPSSVPAGEPIRYPTRYQRSIAALGWPGAKRAFQVGDGSAVSSGETTLEWRLLPADSTTRSVVMFERDGAPVAHWEMRRGDLRLTFEAAAAPVERLGDTSLVASIMVIAEAAGDTASDVVLETRVRATPAGPHAIPWDAPDTWSFEEYWRGHAAYRNGHLVAVVDVGAKLPDDAPSTEHPATFEGAGPGHLVARSVARLEPGERRTWRFWMPLYPTSLDAATLDNSAAHERVVAAAREFWRDWLTRATRFETNDGLVTGAWRAAIVNLVMCHERDGSRWMPIGNPFQYRDVWIRDGARAVRALAEVGLVGLASDDARTLAAFQLPSGALISQRGQLDGTGQALWAFEQASALGPDPALARELLPFAARGLDWIDQQRRATIELKIPFAGLLPYGDPRDAELARAQLVGNDAWGIAGCDAVAALAHRAGDDSLAARAAALARDYRATFAGALARTRSRDVPPSWQGVGRDWGNVTVGYPTRALPLDDPRIRAMADRIRKRAEPPHQRRGTADHPPPPIGLTSYGPADSLHTYYGGDLAQWSLLTGHPEEAQAWLRGLLAHSSSTLGQAEIFDRVDGGFGDNMPPHATASAMLIDLLRNMVVCDLRDTLDLGLGSFLWIDDTAIENAPTRFGRMTVRLSIEDGVARARMTEAPVPVRVRVPLGYVATATESPGARIASPQWVEAPAGVTEIAFRIQQVSGGLR